MMLGAELASPHFAEAIAGEINLPASTGMVIEIEQQMTNRAAFQSSDERRHTCSISQIDSRYLRDFEMARFDEVKGVFFG